MSPNRSLWRIAAEAIDLQRPITKEFSTMKCSQATSTQWLATDLHSHLKPVENDTQEQLVLFGLPPIASFGRRMEGGAAVSVGLYALELE
jgi:hypothetical protein